MIPWKFVYYSDDYKQKIHISVLEKINHHYTGETIYRVREQAEFGWIDEGFYSENMVCEWLKNKVGEPA